MRKIAGVLMVGVLQAGGLVCYAQESGMPFSQFEWQIQSLSTQTLPNAPANMRPTNPREAVLINAPVAPVISVKLTLPESSVRGYFSSSLGADTAYLEAAATAWIRPVPAPRAIQTMDAKYFLVNGLHLGMGMFDVAMTQRCIANNHCREGNPMMPSSLAGQLGVNFGYAAYSSFISYKLKKHHSRFWWTSPALGITAHSVGVASDFSHQ